MRVKQTKKKFLPVLGFVLVCLFWSVTQANAAKYLDTVSFQDWMELENRCVAPLRAMALKKGVPAAGKIEDILVRLQKDPRAKLYIAAEALADDPDNEVYGLFRETIEKYVEDETRSNMAAMLERSTYDADDSYDDEPYEDSLDSYSASDEE